MPPAERVPVSATVRRQPGIHGVAKSEDRQSRTARNEGTMRCRRRGERAWHRWDPENPTCFSPASSDRAPQEQEGGPVEWRPRNLPEVHKELPLVPGISTGSPEGSSTRLKGARLAHGRASPGLGLGASLPVNRQTGNRQPTRASPGRGLSDSMRAKGRSGWRGGCGPGRPETGGNVDESKRSVQTKFYLTASSLKHYTSEEGLPSYLHKSF